MINVKRFRFHHIYSAKIYLLDDFFVILSRF